MADTNPAAPAAGSLNPSEDADSLFVVAHALSASELFYVSKGRSLKALIILCEGLEDKTGASLLDFLFPCGFQFGRLALLSPILLN